MALLQPVIYHCCVRCDGLFHSAVQFTQHVVICTGDRQRSDCQLFACPRDVFLSFKKLKSGSTIGSSTESFGDTHPADMETQNRLSLQSTLRKVKVIGIVKKTVTQHFARNDNVSLGSDGERGVSIMPNFKEAHQGLLYPENLHKSLQEAVDITIRTDNNLNNQTGFSQSSVHPQQLQMISSHICFHEDGKKNACNKPVQQIQEMFGTDQSQKMSMSESQDNDLSDPDGIYAAAEAADELRNPVPDDESADRLHWQKCEKQERPTLKCQLSGCGRENEVITRQHVQTQEMLPSDRCDHNTTCSRDITLDNKHKSQASPSKNDQPYILCKSNFTCQYGECGYVAMNSANLRDHMRKHTGETLHCDYDHCKFFTKFEKALALHTAKHEGKTRFICEVCGYKTIEAGSFKRHSLTHTGKKLFKCPDCNYKANSRYVIVKHIYGKHINHKRYACNRCEFKTAYYSGLSMHLMSHEGVKPYKCSVCPYRSNLSNKVKRHCSQKHKGTVAKIEKVENCLKFDVKDFMNPEIGKIDVKVIRLTEDGEEEVEDTDEDGPPVPTVIDPDVSEDEALLCQTNIPTLPTEGAETLEAISMLDGGFNLCTEPTFPLDSSQAFQSDDSNTTFVTRASQLICQAAADGDLSKVFEEQKSKVLSLESPESGPLITEESSQNNQDIANNKIIYPNFSIQRSKSMESLTNSKVPESLSKESKTDLDLKDLPQVSTLQTNYPVLASSSPFFQVITVPLIAVPPLITTTSQPAGEPSRSLKSLLSPNVLKSLSKKPPNS